MNDPLWWVVYTTFALSAVAWVQFTLEWRRTGSRQ